MKGAAPLFALSWILLLALAILITVLTIGSTLNAYRGAPDNVSPGVSVQQVEALGPDVVSTLRGRRATAATWALGYGLLLAFVVLVPYRRRERWAWWALLISLGVAQLLSIARVVALGMTSGAGTSGILLALLLIALMAGVPQLFLSRHDD